MNNLFDKIASFLEATRPTRSGGTGKRTPFLGTRRVHVSARAERRALGNYEGGRLVQHKPRPQRDPAVAERMAEIRRRPVRRAGTR